jgi:hypothetical protein
MNNYTLLFVAEVELFELRLAEDVFDAIQG